MDKKITLKTAGILLAVLLTTACASAPSSIDNKDELAAGTPEDSVLVYGGVPLLCGMHFAQVNTALPPRYILTTTEDFFYFPPVAPGSRYILAYTQTYLNNYQSFMNGMPDNPVTIDVPNKPGLYYAAFLNAFTSDESLWGDDYGKHPEKLELKALKAMKKTYAKTAWAPLINDRIAELEAKKK